MPFTSRPEIGHKKGVGKKTWECVGISMRICRPQADISQSGFLNIAQIIKKAIKKTIRLCVAL